MRKSPRSGQPPGEGRQRPAAVYMAAQQSTLSKALDRIELADRRRGGAQRVRNRLVALSLGASRLQTGEPARSTRVLRPHSLASRLGSSRAPARSPIEGYAPNALVISLISTTGHLVKLGAHATSSSGGSS